LAGFEDEELQYLAANGL